LQSNGALGSCVNAGLLCRTKVTPRCGPDARRDRAHAQLTIRETINDERDITTVDPDVAQQAIIHASQRLDHFAAFPAAEGGPEPMSNTSGFADVLFEGARSKVRSEGFEDVRLHDALHGEQIEPGRAHHRRRSICIEARRTSRLGAVVTSTDL
jgi:hypothetical protein